MSAFRPGQSARVAHSSLQTAISTMEKAQNCAVLWFAEIMRRKLYRDLNYSSINQYAQQGLGWSRTRTTDFIQLSQKLEKLPEVKKQVTSGELGYTKARELVKVADGQNEKQWLELARKKTRRELEVEIKQAKRAASDGAKGQTSLLPPSEPRPVAIKTRVSLEMSPTQFARYEVLWEQIRKRGGLPTDQVEALLSVMAGFLADESEMPPRGGIAPVQIHVHQCPDCEKATVQTSRGEIELSESEVERTGCDAQVSRPGKRNTATIPPKTRREVLARDRHRCRRKGCDHTRFLEVHHIVPRSRGGGNDLDNLITLCSSCHALLHQIKTNQWGLSERSEEARTGDGPDLSRSSQAEAPP